ncbi:MAG: IS630 family transposase ISPpu2 [Syntrophus sp. SKADARSKE-3]|nr:IS630 family transposase ISPpu2 [Syntrophus sp. SKADARSKE-3]
MGRPHENYEISDSDRNPLEALIRSPKTPQSLALRARIILLSSSGETVEAVAASTGTTNRSVYKWRKRFKTFGIDGLKDLPRSGQPKKLSEQKIKTVLKLTVERIPHEATHWSVRLMAKYAGVTTWQVRQIWDAADLKPHRIKGFKISNDPYFAEKVIDVVGLYMNPPDNAVVLSVDEKTQIQALDRTLPMLPLRPGQIERRTHDYKRNGTMSLYAAFDILTGEVTGRVTRRHRSKEFLDFLRQVERCVPKELDLHLVMDNSSTHKTDEVRAWLERHPRIKVHFTPTSASWLNAVESWFSQLEKRSLHRGVFCNVMELSDEIHRFIKAHNAENAKPFKWTKKADTIIEAVQRAKRSRELLERTNHTGH